MCRSMKAQGRQLCSFCRSTRRPHQRRRGGSKEGMWGYQRRVHRGGRKGRWGRQRRRSSGSKEGRAEARRPGRRRSRQRMGRRSVLPEEAGCYRQRGRCRVVRVRTCSVRSGRGQEQHGTLGCREVAPSPWGRPYAQAVTALAPPLPCSLRTRPAARCSNCRYQVTEWTHTSRHRSSLSRSRPWKRSSHDSPRAPGSVRRQASSTRGTVRRRALYGSRYSRKALPSIRRCHPCTGRRKPGHRRPLSCHRTCLRCSSRGRMRNSRCRLHNSGRRNNPRQTPCSSHRCLPCNLGGRGDIPWPSLSSCRHRRRGSNRRWQGRRLRRAGRRPIRQQPCLPSGGAVRWRRSRR